MNEHETKRRRETVAGLRALADLLEREPEFPLPYIGNIYVFTYTANEFLRLRRLGGLSIKNADEQHLRVEKHLSADMNLVLCMSHDEVCERVQVGERTFPAEPARHVDAKPARVEPIYEWRCPESFLALADQAAEPEATT